MRIALIAQSINTHSGSRAPLELAKQLAKNNQITIFSYPYNADKNLVVTLEKSKIKVILLPHKNRSTVSQIKNTLELAKKIRSSDYDIVSSHCLPPLFMATWFLKIPTVATYYGTQKNVLAEKSFPQKLSPVNYFAERILNLIIFLEQWTIVNFSSKTIAISKYSAQEAQKLYHRKLNHIYLGSISRNLISE